MIRKASSAPPCHHPAFKQALIFGIRGTSSCARNEEPDDDLTKYSEIDADDNAGDLGACGWLQARSLLQGRKTSCHLSSCLSMSEDIVSLLVRTRHYTWTSVAAETGHDSALTGNTKKTAQHERCRHTPLKEVSYRHQDTEPCIHASRTQGENDSPFRVGYLNTNGPCLPISSIAGRSVGQLHPCTGNGQARARQSAEPLALTALKLLRPTASSTRIRRSAKLRMPARLVCLHIIIGERSVDSA
ncbi:hypothetical protein KC359_g152 [Hortaea werneckii]|nr:hypothetical protein KC359_g152 [Hortaea werneckii]